MGAAPPDTTACRILRSDCTGGSSKRISRSSSASAAVCFRKNRDLRQTRLRDDISQLLHEFSNLLLFSEHKRHPVPHGMHHFDGTSMIRRAFHLFVDSTFSRPPFYCVAL